MKKLTKSQADSLPSVSVRGERYVHLEALQSLLEEQSDAVHTEPEAKNADSKPASKRSDGN